MGWKKSSQGTTILVPTFRGSSTGTSLKGKERTDVPTTKHEWAAVGVKGSPTHNEKTQRRKEIENQPREARESGIGG